MEIVLIRHGQPNWLHGEEYTMDPSLSNLGVEQAKLSSDALRKESFHEVWVSDLKRAQETLSPFKKNNLSKNYKTLSWLREMGDEKEKGLIGKSKKEISDFFENRNTRPLEEWVSNYHGKYFKEFSTNILVNLEKELELLGVKSQNSEIDRVFTLNETEKQRLLIISHAGTMSVLFSYFLNIPLQPWTWRKYLPVHCAHSSLRSARIEGGYIFRMKKFNDSSFYKKDNLVTY